MQNTNLVQRLCPPRDDKMGVRNPFSFGAGGGRLSPKALDLLAPVLTFDYMMKGEFEFGAVPEGLSKIHDYATANNLFFSTIDIAVKDVKLDTSYLNQPLREWKSCPVYIIGAKSDQAEIERRIRLMATDEDRCCAEMWKHFKGKLHEGMYLCVEPLLNRQIKLVPTRDRPIVGWIELDNGFFFSIDRVMTEKFAKLFGLNIEIHAS